MFDWTYLYLWAICPFVSALIAWMRGASILKWFLVGVVFGPLGIIVALRRAGK